MASTTEALTLAIKHHQAGQLAVAETIYRQILEVEPQQADAIHLLGVIAHQKGDHVAAVSWMSKAIEISPLRAAIYSNLSLAYHALGRFQEAEASARRATDLEVNNAAGWCNLGLAILAQCRYQEAVLCFEQAIRLQPGYAQAHSNLGSALYGLQRYAESAEQSRIAIRLQPDSAGAYVNLSNALMELGDSEEALNCLQQALRIRPNLAQAHYNLANVFCRGKRFDEAVASYQQAIQCNPNYAEAYNNLGNILKEQGRIDEAIACHREALRCQPNFMAAHSNLLMDLNYSPNVEVDSLFAEHLQWARSQCQSQNLSNESEKPEASATDLYKPQRRCDNNPISNRPLPLRVGYVSPDFKGHPVAAFVGPILAAHDPEQVEVFCYSHVQQPDAITARLQGRVQNWRNILSLSDEEAARLIEADDIDILVDLAGHSGDNRLGIFMRKPALVQVTYLGYPNTTGLAEMDYFLTDAVADPPGEPARYTERLWRLPGCFCCYEPQEIAPDVSSPPASQGAPFTFGSLHNLAKLNGRVLDLWCLILDAVPSSRLLICRDTLTPHTAAYFRAQLAQRGIAEDRYELRNPGETDSSYLCHYADIDVTLDVFPWSGHATTCESLWMGVPVLTLRGDRHAGRMAASVLTCLGLTEWIAETEHDYVALAVQWANRRAELARFRAVNRERMRRSALCDGKAFTRGLEAAYRQMAR